MSLVAGLNGWQTALVTLAAIGVVVIIGSYLTRPLFRFIASAQLRELFTATALLIVIGIALLMSLVGLSPALGTFLAGVVLANSEYRHELESDIDPFKGLLLGVFFMTVGAGINFGLLFGKSHADRRADARSDADEGARALCAGDGLQAARHGSLAVRARPRAGRRIRVRAAFLHGRQCGHTRRDRRPAAAGGGAVHAADAGAFHPVRPRDRAEILGGPGTRSGCHRRRQSHHHCRPRPRRRHGGPDAQCRRLQGDGDRLQFADDRKCSGASA